MFKNKNSYTCNINFKTAKPGCKPGMMLLIAPVAGLFASYASYTSFREGDKTEGYIIAGVSAFLIIAPVSYIIYCSNHGWH